MENIKHQTFPVKTLNDWKVESEKTLKGKTLESLTSTTYEKIFLKPLYTSEDQQKIPDYPGGPDFRRGINSLAYVTNEWKIAQRLSYQSTNELKEKLMDALQKGQSAISFEVSRELFETDKGLSFILPETYTSHPFAINAKGLLFEFLSALRKTSIITSDRLTGFIGSDVLSLFAKEGVISEEFLRNWLRTITQTIKLYPNLRTILVDTTPYHNGGANAVQELGIAAAEGVFYLDQLQDYGMDVDQILKKVVFQFSIGSNFFMELAKLRAARIIWGRITGLYGAKVENSGMIIAAETSSCNKTIHDPHVNLLRAGNEAFAAIIGGVQYLHVDPFDSLTGSTIFSERLARNTQLILKEETHLKKVIDPAGGSWYIESLTNELAERAWEFFQQIEAAGGVLESLKSNWLQAEIAAVFKKRNMDVQTRKQSVIGTNVYPNLDEKVSLSFLSKSDTNYVRGEYSTVEIESIVHNRLAKPFEELRKKAKFLEENDSIPSIGLICLGELKQYKPRLDFMKGFLAAGGIKAVESMPIVMKEDAEQFIAGQRLPFYCLCGANEQYDLNGKDILQAIKREFPEKMFYLAGLPDKAEQVQWQKYGIHDFIHKKTNCYEILNVILDEWEMWNSEKSEA